MVFDREKAKPASVFTEDFFVLFTFSRGALMLESQLVKLFGSFEDRHGRQ
jgi:hypothetical protein